MLRLIIVAFSLLSASAKATDGFLHEPAVRGDRLVFVARGQLWEGSLTGGAARQLTDDEGVKSGPQLSPKGDMVAYTVSYGRNSDVFVMQLGDRKRWRVTWHPAADVVQGWARDGRSLLLFSSRQHSHGQAGKQAGNGSLFEVGVMGGSLRRLPPSKAFKGALSPDGQRLAFTPAGDEFSTWRGYRGGKALPMRVVSLADATHEDLSEGGSNTAPLWLKSGLFFLSDRAGRFAIYRQDAGRAVAVVAFPDKDVESLSGDDRTLVFATEGRLWKHDLETSVTWEIPMKLTPRPADPVVMDVASDMQSLALARDGLTLAIEARGKLFVKDPGKPARLLTRGQGFAERAPVWSPARRQVAFVSDEGGTVHIRVRDVDGHSPDIRVETAATGYPEALQISPDGRRIAYLDATRRVNWADISGKASGVGRAEAISGATFEWGPDSGSITYIERLPTSFGRLRRLDLATGQDSELTDGMAHVTDFKIQGNGNELLVVASLDAGPTVTEYDASTMLFAPSVRAMVYRLRLGADGKPVMTALAMTAGHHVGAGRIGATPVGRPGQTGLSKSLFIAKTGDIVTIQRTNVAPPWVDWSRPRAKVFEAQPIWSIRAFDAGAMRPSAAQNDEKVSRLLAGRYHNSAAGSILLFDRDGKALTLSLDSGAKISIKELDIGPLVAPFDPKAERRQIYAQAARSFRDYFYDPAMHGVDWDRAVASFRPLLERAADRGDLDYVLTKLAAEVGNSHIRIVPPPAGSKGPPVAGLLGIDVRDTGEGTEIVRVLETSPWDSVVSPLAGIARPGDRIVSVNGFSLAPGRALDEMMVDTASRPTRLTLDRNGALINTVVVPLADEFELRMRDWIESRRRLVHDLSDGRIAYLHSPDTSQGGMAEFVRYFFPQTNREGLIVDVRFNRGGADLDYLLDTMGRTRLHWYTARGLQPFEAPTSLLTGPKLMLVNAEASSGGDVFPYQFKSRKLGTVIGTRTWGGANGGYRGAVPTGFIDGGQVTVPDLGVYSPDGSPILENIGFEPDEIVDSTPADDVAGRDVAVERGVAILMKKLANTPSEAPPAAFQGHRQMGTNSGSSILPK